MSSNPRDDLLKVAGASAKALGAEDDETIVVVVSVEVDGEQQSLRVAGRAPPDAFDDPPERPSWMSDRHKWLSEIAEKVIRLLQESGDWVSAEVIAERVGEACTPAFKGRLQDLVDRGFIESSQGRGYRWVKEEKGT